MYQGSYSYFDFEKSLTYYREPYQLSFWHNWMHYMIAFLGLNFVILVGSPKIPRKNAFLAFKMWNNFKPKYFAVFGKRRIATSANINKRLKI